MSKFACQSVLLKSKTQSSDRNRANRQQRPAAAWPPHAMTGLPSLPGVLHLEAASACLSAHSSSSSFTSSTHQKRRSGATAPPLSHRARARSPSRSTSLQLARSFALPSFTISVRL